MHGSHMRPLASQASGTRRQPVAGSCKAAATPGRRPSGVCVPQALLAAGAPDRRKAQPAHAAAPFRTLEVGLPQFCMQTIGLPFK
jgi:hypothetical protein